MTHRSLVQHAIFTLGLAACGDAAKTDSAPGASADSGAADTGGGDEVGCMLIYSCSFDDAGVCVEAFSGQDALEGWCAEIGELYGMATSYARFPCPGHVVGSCDITDVEGDDFPFDATVYYYSDFPSDAEGACADARGAWYPG